MVKNEREKCIVCKLSKLRLDQKNIDLTSLSINIRSIEFILTDRLEFKISFVMIEY